MRSPMKPQKLNGIYDYLGLAAEAKQEGMQAVKSGNYDDAWYYFHEQQSAYAKHINSPNGHFTPEQAFSLLSVVNEQLANVLRLESKHRQAIVHIVYWAAWGNASGRVKKSMNSKLKSYFKRCHFEQHNLDELEKLVEHEARSTPDFARIQSLLSEWR